MVRHYWKPSVFDRGEMTPHGLASRSPDVAIELTGSVKSKATYIHVFLRGYGSEGSDAIQVPFADL